MSETSCAYMKRRDTLYQINKKYFAKPFWLSFLCIQGARANGDRIYRRCCAKFWLQQTGTRADKKGNACSCELSFAVHCQSQTILYVIFCLLTWCLI